MVLNIFFEISADIRSITAIAHATAYHLFDKPGRRLTAVGNSEYYHIPSSHALLFEHGRRINIKQIVFVLRKRYEIYTDYTDTASHLPFK